MDACFSGSTLALVGTLMTALTGAIGILFGRLMLGHSAALAACQEDAQRERQEKEYFRDRLMEVIPLADKATTVAERATSIAQERPRR